MASVDTRFSDDIQEMRKDPSKTIDPVDFSDAERQRNSFLYSMLSSLLRQRPLMVVRQVGNSKWVGGLPHACGSERASFKEP